jgi:hypothetical protein
MKALNRTYLVLAILFGVVALLQCVRWSSSSGTVSLGYLLTLLPSAAFTGAYLLTAKAPRRRVHLASLALSLLACGVWGFITLGVEMVLKATTEVTNVRKYDEILTNYWASEAELVSHFPQPIPSSADNVRFSFLPAFLQGGAHIQLRYAATARDISELYNRFAVEKTQSFFGGDINDHINATNGMPTTSFHTSPPQGGKFPKDYEVMVFDPVPTNRADGISWNHGRSHGVAISTNRNEIVFWAESW